MTFIYIFFLVLITTLPILFWDYIVSNSEKQNYERTQFLLGFFSGAISVVPILYFGDILTFFSLDFTTIVQLSSIQLQHFGLLVAVLFISIVLLACFIYLLRILYNSKDLFRSYIKHVCVFGIIILLYFVIITSSIHVINSNNVIPHESILFFILYYFIIASIEESTKHFNILPANGTIFESRTNTLHYAIFVALGFSLFENITYLYAFYKEYGLGIETVQFYALRSLFSSILHIIASTALAYYFFLAFTKKHIGLQYIGLIALGLFVSIVIHTSFNLSLHLGFNAITIFFCIISYFILTAIFQKK